MCGGIKTRGYEKEKPNVQQDEGKVDIDAKRIVTHWVLYPQKDHYRTKRFKAQDNGNKKKKRYESHLFDKAQGKVLCDITWRTRRKDNLHRSYFWSKRPRVVTAIRWQGGTRHVRTILGC